MQLPHAQRAIVDKRKIVDYLLNPVHPDGAGKAAFFAGFGFAQKEWSVLAEALKRHGQTCAVTKTVESPYGTRYIAEGSLETPSGRRPAIRTVWMIESGTLPPRLITAHPL